MIAAIIAADPSTITITRHTKVPNVGGFSYTDTVLAPFTARVYHYATRNQSEVTIAEGEVKTIITGLLVDGITVDIVVGHASYDTFVHEGRKYRIVGVRRYDDVNLDIHTQADCVAA